MIDNPIEDLLSRAHPNPQRIGCPGIKGLMAMVYNPVPLNDPLSEHVWHCSPCFREFAALRDAKRARARQMVMTKITAGALAIFAGTALLLHSKAHNSDAAPVQMARLDFSDEVVERGVDPNATASVEEQSLPSSTRTLTFVLPSASDTGPYEVEIRAASDIKQAIKAGKGLVTKEADGRAVLRWDLTAPSLPTGSYVAAWRISGTEFWHYGMFRVR